ncbi:hypothetical protein ARMSODRAFT_356252 [Armillaria solidipes]|uniref:F-box domain-containing protein n=1 Tax=Armillaria solidipes TaxID=1076256 RepID=A0A2H3BGV8_9AGAR|nr:hypothetical protein ARMSODRAFT_356252 [Armillaria solidipes]
MATPTLKRKCSSDCGDALAQEFPRKRERLACGSDSLLSSPPSSLPDLPNELLLKIFAVLPNTVKVILTLATTCRRLNEFAMAYHFGSVSCYEFCGSSSNRPAGKKCGKRTQSRPFTSFRMLRLSFIYNPPLAVIRCKFSNNFHMEMKEVKRSLPALKRMDLPSGRFSVSFEHMGWPKVPTETHVAFFEDLSKLGCMTIDMAKRDPWFVDAPRARTSEIVVFDPPVLTKLSKVTLSECPEQYIAWMLRCIEESPIETLDLRSLSDDVLLKINEFSLSNLQKVTLLHCTFGFAAFSAFLERYPHITTLHLRTWNPISRIARRSLRGSEHPKMSLEPATRMSLTCISGTAMTLRALLSTAEVFPVLQSVIITGEDTLGTQEALLLISQIPTVDRLSIRHKDLNAADWLKFKFPRWRGLDVKRAEALLTGVTDFSISFHTSDAAEVPAAVALIPNLRRFRTTLPKRSKRAILGFVGRMKDACPGLDSVVVNSSDFSTDPRWLQQKEMELKEKKRK